MNYMYKASKNGYITILDGIERKTLVCGGNTLMTEFRLMNGKTLPMHNHPEEQTGYLVSGHIMLSIGDVDYEICKGDAWVIPGGNLHGVKVFEDSIAVEVFSPARKDYMP